LSELSRLAEWCRERLPKWFREFPVVERDAGAVHTYIIMDAARRGEERVELDLVVSELAEEAGVDAEEAVREFHMVGGDSYWEAYHTVRANAGEWLRRVEEGDSETARRIADNLRRVYNRKTKVLRFQATSSYFLTSDFSEIAVETQSRAIISIEGTVISRTDPVSEELRGVFKCPKCGEVIEVKEWNPVRVNAPRRPRCPKCGGEVVAERVTGPTTVFLDVQEPLEEAGHSPRRLKVAMRFPLTVMEDVMPGDRVIITGTPKPVYRRPSIGGEIGEIIFEAIGIRRVKREETRRVAPPSPEDPVEWVKERIAPGLVGMDEVKELLALQLFSTVEDSDGFRNRIHVLLIGKPAAGKSRLLKSVARLYGIYASAEHTTGAGLTVAAERAEGGWRLRAGAAILADGMILAIDELDKARKSDLNYLLELMESGRASVAKAGITTEIKSSVTVLAAANPDETKLRELTSTPTTLREYIEEVGHDTVIADLCNITAPLASRFDVVTLIEPITDPTTITHALRSQYEHTHRVNSKEIARLRALIDKAKQYEPNVPEAAWDELERTLDQFQQAGLDLDPRNAATILRLALARARAHRRDVTPQDITHSAELYANTTILGLVKNLEKASKPRKLSIKQLRDTILETARELGADREPIPINDLLQRLEDRVPQHQLDQARQLINDLIDEGKLLQPEPGHVQLLQ